MGTSRDLKTKEPKKPKRIKEVFTVAPTQGAAALMIGLEKPGYRMTGIKREGNVVTVTFVLI